MMRWLADYLRDACEGWRILRTRRFWQDFRHYWSLDQVTKRMDAWADRQRH